MGALSRTYVAPKHQHNTDWLGASKGVGRPPTGVPKLVLGGPVKLGGLPTKTCTRAPQYIGVSIYINNVHVGSSQWRAS